MLQLPQLPQSTAPDAYDDGANDYKAIEGRGCSMAAASSRHNLNNQIGARGGGGGGRMCDRQ